MVRIARTRISDLFSMAEVEAARGSSDLADRYVQLARKIGTRYNVRLPSEYRELYCRGCSAFWIEGRTVRTRMRGGRRVRTCLRCQRSRRTPLRASHRRSGASGGGERTEARRDEGALAVPLLEEDLEAGDEESEEE